MNKLASALIVVFFASVFNAQVKDGLVAKYSFNKGDARDDCGYNHAEAYGVSLTEDRFGNQEMAYYLSGSVNSFLNLGTSDVLKPEKGTISLWVNLHVILSKGRGVETNPIITTKSNKDEDCNQAYYIGFDLNTRRINGSISSSCMDVATIYSKNEIARGQWYYLALVYDDNSMSFYVDGKLQYKTEKNFKTVFLKGSPIIVGNINDKKNQRFFLGAIDDIRIYNRSLSEKEILELYAEPNPNKIKIFLKWIGFGFLLLLLIAATVFLIRKRIQTLLDKEKEKNQLRNNWYEQENRVLMAQMDPHFIFNSLNTIQQFIIINDNDKAQLYLSKFSRLLRMILESNVKDRISLKEEIEINTQYLEIESLRFNNVFSYKIDVEEGINSASINIPRFLIQPFIENAIWHGVLPKEGEKHINVYFEVLKESLLKVTIDDNGIGRKEAGKIKSLAKNKSLAITFIQQRLLLMSKIYKEEYGIEIIDKINSEGTPTGTKIRAIIPILKK
jgi:hypothetical protein